MVPIFPLGTKYFDVEDVAVARLPDGTCVAVDKRGPRHFSNHSKVSVYGMPITEEEFRKLAAE